VKLPDYLDGATSLFLPNEERLEGFEHGRMFALGHVSYRLCRQMQLDFFQSREGIRKWLSKVRSESVRDFA
jgi:hypothetical protein